jgi:hypothetical protein
MTQITEQYWFDMPEFEQPKKEPYTELKIRFASEEDLQDFANLIGQKLTVKTKSIWHPELVRGLNGGKRYVAEE